MQILTLTVNFNVVFAQNFSKCKYSLRIGYA